MAFKLAIGNVIDFPVHIKVRDAVALKSFKFSVQAKRIDADQAKDLMTEGTRLGDQTVNDFLVEQIIGWRGQCLVLDEADQPAAYSPEALAQVQTIPGASNTLYQTYLAAVLATDGAQGVQKN